MSTRSGSEPADRVLVARALDGEAAAFGLLFRRHGPAVHGFAQRRTRSVDLADDVVSAAFEKGWRGLDQLGARSGDRFRPWIFRIAANEMASMMRSSSRRRDREHLAAVRGELTVDRRERSTRAADADLIIDRVARSASIASVLDALDGLDDRHQEVIALRFLADLSPAETATALGLSRGNVAVLTHRALRALRAEMEETS